MAMRKRITSLIVVFAMVFAMAFSVLFIVHKAEHKCTGVDCQICQLINTCVEQLNNLTPKPKNASLLISQIFALILVIGAVIVQANKNTLIDLKIKLSN